jgi:asparagine synthase (glutamine-hydrolysing)
MCGIAGILALEAGSGPVNADELIFIREAMASRGPDAAGLWLSPDHRVALANRRLAIIDLDKRSDQPMSLPEAGLWITFNGEITNFRELRAELSAEGRIFRTQSDTEVLLHLYDRYGSQMVDRLRGMFAFALWDDRRKRLFAARDPWGILPFYYAHHGATLRFASQVKALRRSRAIPCEADAAGQVGFLLLGYVPEPHTLHAQIRSLPAGSILTYDQHGLAIQNYCDIADLLRERAASPAIAAYRPALREALADAVSHSLVADVPLAVFLSGGTDSNAIASFARAAGHKLTGITIGFSEFRGGSLDETNAAEETARAFEMPHLTRWVEGAEFADERAKIIAAMDQPSIDGANSYFAAKAAKEAGFKIALSGVGGDELFAGYPSYGQIPRLVRLLQLPGLQLAGGAFRLLSAPLLRHIGKPKWAGLIEYGGDIADAYLLRRGLYMPWELPSLLDPEIARAGWRGLEPLLRMRWTAKGMPTARSAITALELTWYMRNQLLRDADWAGMAHGVEIRPPFLDLPLLRTLAPLIASPAPPTKADLVACLDPLPPASVLQRPKLGFMVPWQEWILGERHDQQPTRVWARDVLHALAA